jgi:uncharacterized protein Usg
MPPIPSYISYVSTRGIAAEASLHCVGYAQVKILEPGTYRNVSYYVIFSIDGPIFTCILMYSNVSDDLQFL